MNDPSGEVASGLTYAEVGATHGGPPPAGFRALTVRHLLGRGIDSRDATRLGDALLSWRVPRAARVDVRASGPVAAPGVHVETLLGVGRLRLTVPCEVVWVERSPQRFGFGYGTLPGHLFRGEEAFTVEHDAAGDLWFVVTAYSTPQARWVRLLGPLTVVGQRLYLRLLAHGARRILRASA